MIPVDLFIFQHYELNKVETNISQIKDFKNGEDLSCIVGHQTSEDFIFCCGIK
jgi:hypothetical protein